MSGRCRVVEARGWSGGSHESSSHHRFHGTHGHSRGRADKQLEYHRAVCFCRESCMCLPVVLLVRSFLISFLFSSLPPSLVLFCLLAVHLLYGPLTHTHTHTHTLSHSVRNLKSTSLTRGRSSAPIHLRSYRTGSCPSSSSVALSFRTGTSLNKVLALRPAQCWLFVCMVCSHSAVCSVHVH